MKPTELRGMSLDELKGELAEQQRGYYNLRFRKSGGEVGEISGKQSTKDSGTAGRKRYK